MSSREMETRYKRLWFGPKARATLGPGFLHRSGFGPLVIPHPPLANWLLRRGLPSISSRDLSFAHEFAHLETTPLILFYMLGILTLAFVRGRIGTEAVLFILASTQGTWEIISEGLVMLRGPAKYRMAYDALPVLPRVLFWAAGSMLTAAGWMVVLYG
jgi:hypothetical protein